MTTEQDKKAMEIEESYLVYLRRRIEEQYKEKPTGCGASFGELLCYEIHENGLTFKWLAEKWGVSVTTLGELIWDHCKRLEPVPEVRHDYLPVSTCDLRVENEKHIYYAK